MIVFYYDKTFEGLLCVVFDAFKLKKIPEILLIEGDVEPLLMTECHHVENRNSKYERVQVALKKRVTKIILNQLISVWLSELPESDLLIFRYICKIFNSHHSITTDFGDSDVLMMRQIAHKVSKEREHLMQFVRFNTIVNPVDSSDKSPKNEQIYFAVVAPIYNALPLTIDFFKDRFADQKWVIYDEKRQYGYFYDLHQVEQITLSGLDDLIVDSKINPSYLTSDEMYFQTMWFRYCKALTIKERLNPKLQRQFMPKRFWPYLPEMKNH